MGEFGDSLKEARTTARKTLKVTSEQIGRSIGYISDMEQGRTGPPDLELVKKFEEFFGITDERLTNLAIKERTMMSTQVMPEFQQRPVLRDLFFRLKNMSDQELKEWLESEPPEK